MKGSKNGLSARLRALKQEFEVIGVRLQIGQICTVYRVASH